MAKIKTLAPLIATIDTRTVKPPPKTVDPFYLTPEWRSLVEDLVRQRGRRCEAPDCRYPGRKGIRVFGDHVVELRDGGALLDPGNVKLLCGSCHTRKTMRERAKRLAS